MCSNYPGIKFVPAIWKLEKKKLEICRYAYILHTIAKQAISRRRLDKNDSESRCFSFSNTTQISDVFVATVVVNWELTQWQRHNLRLWLVERGKIIVLSSDDVEFWFLRFCRHCLPAAVNFSFFAFAWKSFVANKRKVYFAYFVKRDQHGIIAKHLT